MRKFKNFQVVFYLFIFSFLFVSPILAAAPDGIGPWADSVVSSSQGLMKNGSSVPAIRSNPNSALGVAENNTVEGNFFSLGFGGNIVLGFDNGISSGVIVVEATNPNYPTERAKIEVSENGTSWITAGEVSADGSVNKPSGVNCAKFVRVTDISNPNDFPDAIADGYDVDGVSATGDPCTPPPAGGDNSNCIVDITQKNNTVVTTTINSSAKTGKNKSNKNTGGSNTITTGNVDSSIILGITGGANQISGSGNCCTCCGSINVNVSDNGAGSTNTVNVNQGSKKLKKVK